MKTNPREDLIMADAPNDLLSTILATFPTLVYSKPESLDQPWVFLSQIQNNSSPDSSDRIRYAFSDVRIGCLDGLIQFWAPTTKQLLTTSDQPFAFANPDDGIVKYRVCCMNHPYNLDPQLGEVSGAFLNQTPKLLLDRSCAGFMSCILLPVYYPCRSSCCVGVVECCTKRPEHLLVYFKKLSAALEREGFKTFHAQYRLPYKTPSNFESVRDGIDLALAVIIRTHNIGLAQVWIACENVSSDTEAKQRVGMKLIGRHYGLPFHYEELGWYDEICDMVSLKMGEGLAGKTLENHEAYFIENISKLGDNELLRLFPHSAEYSCFLICLKTKNLDYAFEFLWHQADINCDAMFRSLVSLLKVCLRGLEFTYASGGEIGDELCILHVDDNYTAGSEMGSFKIFERNNVAASSIRLTKKTRRPLLNKAATQDVVNANDALKRKLSKMDIGEKISKRSRAFEDSLIINGDGDGETILTIIAQHRGDSITFPLPISSATFVGIKLRLGRWFMLLPFYKLSFLDDEGNWILMNSDADMRLCINQHASLNSTRIRLRCQA